MVFARFHMVFVRYQSVSVGISRYQSVLVRYSFGTRSVLSCFSRFSRMLSGGARYAHAHAACCAAVVETLTYIKMTKVELIFFIAGFRYSALPLFRCCVSFDSIHERNISYVFKSLVVPVTRMVDRPCLYCKYSRGRKEYRHALVDFGD